MNAKAQKVAEFEIPTQEVETAAGQLLPPQKESLAPRAPQAVTPMALLQIAVTQGADIEKLSKLMDLHERWEANEARKAYVHAMSAFKADLPQILKNRHVKFGNTEYDHATLDNVCDQVAPALSKYGLSHRWKVEQLDGRIRVTCILTHVLGHAEETTLEGSPDTSGSKNSIQAIGSAITYLQRYSLLAATGLAAKGQDSDGRAHEQMPGEEDALRAIAEAPDASALARIFKEATAKALLAKNGPAIVRLDEARNKRRKELAAEEPA